MTLPAPAQLGLTARQRECFDAIEHYIATQNRSPSLADLVPMLGLKSKSGIYRLLEGLRERGWITWSSRMARSIVVLRSPSYVLPPAIEAKLRAHCAVNGETPADVVADAVALFFDESEGSIAA